MEQRFDKIVWIGLENFISEYVTAFATALTNYAKIQVQIIKSRNPNLQFNKTDTSKTLFILSLGTKIREIARFPPVYIVHQTEQYSQPLLALPNSPYHSILKSAFWIWDYSWSNIDFIKQHNRIENISHFPFSYLPELEYPIASKTEFKYEALFIGTLSKRRIEVLKKLTSCGLRVRTGGLVFGEEKQRLISEAAIVLNIHYDEPSRSILETERIGLLLANRCCVVSEFSSEHETIDSHYSNAVVFASSPEDMVVQCRHLLQVTGLLEFWRESSYQWFKENNSSTLDFSPL